MVNIILVILKTMNATGFDTIIYDNGDTYTGNWKNHYREGVGIYKYNKPKLGSKGFKAYWHLDSIQYYIELQ